MAQWVQKNKVGAKLTVQFKKRDTQNKGYLSNNHIIDSITQAGAKLSKKQMIIVDCVKPNSKGLYPYNELLQLLVGDEEAA